MTRGSSLFLSTFRWTGSRAQIASLIHSIQVGKEIPEEIILKVFKMQPEILARPKVLAGYRRLLRSKLSQYVTHECEYWPATDAGHPISLCPIGVALASRWSSGGEPSGVWVGVVPIGTQPNRAGDGVEVLYSNPHRRRRCIYCGERSD